MRGLRMWIGVALGLMAGSAQARGPLGERPPQLQGLTHLTGQLLESPTALNRPSILINRVGHLLRNPATSAGGFARRIERKSQPGGEVAGLASGTVATASALERAIARLPAHPGPRQIRRTYEDLAGGRLHQLGRTLMIRAASLDRAIPEGDPLKASAEIIVKEAARVASVGNAVAGLRSLRHINPRPADLGKLLRGVTNGIQADGGKDARVVVEVHPDAERARVDPKRLAIAFRGVLRNAWGAIPEGGAVHISAEPFQRGVVLRVTDEGRGIPAKDLQSLSAPLMSSSEIRLGLGLTRARLVAEAHGGALFLGSTEGKGTTVAFWLPGARETGRQ